MDCRAMSAPQRQTRPMPAQAESPVRVGLHRGPSPRRASLLGRPRSPALPGGGTLVQRGGELAERVAGERLLRAELVDDDGDRSVVAVVARRLVANRRGDGWAAQNRLSSRDFAAPDGPNRTTESRGVPPTCLSGLVSALVSAATAAAPAGACGRGAMSSAMDLPASRCRTSVDARNRCERGAGRGRRWGQLRRRRPRKRSDRGEQQRAWRACDLAALVGGTQRRAP